MGEVVVVGAPLCRGGLIVLYIGSRNNARGTKLKNSMCVHLNTLSQKKKAGEALFVHGDSRKLSSSNIGQAVRIWQC